MHRWAISVTKVGMKVLLANPRGFCAGVDRAVQALQHAIDTYGPPVYVRHEIIHNKPVVEDFIRQGVIFIDDAEEIPVGSVALFSAHGVPQRVFDTADKNKLNAIDATCPLVTKVHNEAKRYSAKGYHILLIGHKGHIEVEGTMGHAPTESVTLVDGLEQAKTVHPPETDQLVILTQTTLSVDETTEMMDILKARFPHVVTPKVQDICYATQNRQDAVKEIAPQVDAMIVVGSKTSSNSNRLRETALEYGCPKAFLVDGAEDLTEDMLEGVKTIGITGGASAPEPLIQGVINYLKPTEIQEITVREETLNFQPPKAIRTQVTIEKPAVS
ncbi:MAG: 4-hydroxy-3-methylbut-2-enyl diphosphate reductase [Alphaproteobacteria bacterium]|nr:4-hydroxy-3-methylbut-2-enyl diphosphate reductase [Alphaproteobacteria bacterium]MDD9920453.1 4-hydroxy-3-methylbut-2-enyl diphosphate reductase [Alphaproteobacteria bacterium]